MPRHRSCHHSLLVRRDNAHGHSIGSGRDGIGASFVLLWVESEPAFRVRIISSLLIWNRLANGAVLSLFCQALGEGKELGVERLLFPNDLA